MFLLTLDKHKSLPLKVRYEPRENLDHDQASVTMKRLVDTTNLGCVYRIRMLIRQLPYEDLLYYGSGKACIKDCL